MRTARTLALALLAAVFCVMPLGGPLAGALPLASIVAQARPLAVAHGLRAAAMQATGTGVSSTQLTSNWSLHSATGVTATGAAISQVGFPASGWYPISVPSTVLAGLVANNVYTDIYSGTNLQSVPDLTTQNWWYRTEFTAASPTLAGQQYWLRFKGVSYRAQVWFNGTEIDANAVGTYVVHEYNVTNLIKAGSANAIAVLVTPPATNCNDLSVCTVDWNPPPPDMNAGIWGQVLLDTSGPVVLRDPYVQSVLPLPATNAADLSVYVDAENGSAGPVTGVVAGAISKAGYPTITFSQTVTIAAGGARQEVAFTPTAYTQLHVANPALWWPYQYGTPNLYTMTVTFTPDGTTTASDSETMSFGIRQFTDYRTTVNGTSFVGYKVNGVPIFFRGGGYIWDMLQRFSTADNQRTISYVKDMGLNTIRLEGDWGNEELYSMADAAGVMIFNGGVCCSAWENETKWTSEQTTVANNSVTSQMRAARAHPSMMVWAYGSDKLPLASVLSSYKSIAAALHWQNPTLDNVATWNNANAGVKMDGPYVWEPPVLWWDTTQAGSAFGTTAEEGTESPPPAESLNKFLAPADQWPIGSTYDYHAGKPQSKFDNIAAYQSGLNARYGTATGLADWTNKTEVMNYETARSFFEAWSSHEYSQSFGTIFWMLNNAWPSVHWNLFDYYGKPGGMYFGTKKADEPLHIAYDYKGQNVYVVNSTLSAASNLTAVATVYNIPTLAVQYTTSVAVNAAANSSTQVLTLPAISGLSTTYFVRLQLKNSAGAVVSDNLYWYSTSPDVLANSSNWYSTAIKSSANLTGLSSLAADSGVRAATTRTVTNGQETVTITLTNTSTTALAFFLRAEVTAGANGLEVLPVTYTDNDVSLFPGESKTITASYATAALGGQSPSLRLHGFNVPQMVTAIP